MFKRLNDESFYNKFYFQDSFYAQCRDVDPLTLEQFDRSAASVRKVVEAPIFKTCRRIIGTGCGDSNIAAFAVKDAFEHYLPDVEYQGVEAIELSRHYEYPADCGDTAAIFISYSGGVLRTIEALRQCRRHGITTVGVTADESSQTARECDILYHTDNPAGDNNTGLRTYYSNLISCVILAAAIAEVRTGKSLLPELREQVKKYHDSFFSQVDAIDGTCFRAAIHFMDKRIIEVAADGHSFWTGKFIQAKILELSGDACSVIDSENYMHVNAHMGPGSHILELVIVNGNDANLRHIAASTNAMVERGKRDVMLFSDLPPERLGITQRVTYCHVPVPDREWNFLSPLFDYLPGAFFAGFRHTTLGEPMFRGGMDLDFFPSAYCSPIDVVDI